MWTSFPLSRLSIVYALSSLSLLVSPLRLHSFKFLHYPSLSASLLFPLSMFLSSTFSLTLRSYLPFSFPFFILSVIRCLFPSTLSILSFLSFPPFSFYIIFILSALHFILLHYPFFFSLKLAFSIFSFLCLSHFRQHFYASSCNNLAYSLPFGLSSATTNSLTSYILRYILISRAG